VTKKQDDGKYVPPVKGESERQWTFNIFAVVPVIGIWCYWKHEGLMASKWLPFYRALVRAAQGRLDGLQAQVEGHVAAKGFSSSIVAGIGFALGLVLAWRRFQNLRYKMFLANALQTEPGFSYIKTVLGELPNYLSMRGEWDTCEWLNTVYGECWAALSGMMGQIMVDYVDPVLDYYKPPGVTSMKFQRFTLGTRPMRFTGARAVQFSRTNKDHVAIDLNVVFDSDMESQVAVQIGKAKSIAIVKDIKLQATMRILLSPFHGRIPSFAGMAISFVGDPFIRLDMDSKGMPLPNAVLKWLGNFITDMILNWYVWPERLGPFVMDGYDGPPTNWYELDRRPTSVLLARVQVLDGISPDLLKEGGQYRLAMWAGNAKQKSYTSVDTFRGNTLIFGKHKQGNGERFEMVLKEPEVEVITISLERVTAGFAAGTVDEEEIARCKVAVRDVMHDNPESKEDMEINYEVPLLNDKQVSQGTLRVGMIHNPMSQGLDSDVGTVWLKIFNVVGVPRMDITGWAEPYFVVKLPTAVEGDPKYVEVKRTAKFKCSDDRAPVSVWDEHMAMNIRIRKDKQSPIPDGLAIRLELWDSDRFSKDTLIASWDKPFADLIDKKGFETGQFRFKGRCPAKLNRRDDSKRPWTDEWSKPFPTEYAEPAKGPKDELECTLQLEASFAWLGYY